MPDLEPFNSSNIEDMAREAGSMDAEEDALHSKYASLFLAHSYINFMPYGFHTLEELQTELGECPLMMQWLTNLCMKWYRYVVSSIFQFWS